MVNPEILIGASALTTKAGLQPDIYSEYFVEEDILGKARKIEI